MGLSLFRGLLLVLTALAFVLGTALATPSSVATAGSSAHPCDHCPEPVPSGHPGAKMMLCGPVACAGAVADTAVPPTLERPCHVGFEYPAHASRTQTGVALPPDPFPPRLTTLV